MYKKSKTTNLRGVEKIIQMCYAVNKGNLYIFIMLDPKKKEKIILKYNLHDKDTGSAEVQVAILTEQMKQLVKHLKVHPKDNHSRRGLLKMVSKRKTLLDYLSRSSTKKYNAVITTLGIKKTNKKK